MSDATQPASLEAEDLAEGRIDMIFRFCFGFLLLVALLFDGSGVADAAQTHVHFPSLDDNGTGEPSTMLDGYLFQAPGDAKHPAVIFLHGCSGLTSDGSISPGYLAWAGELNRLGYAVLMVDSFAARNIEGTCSLRARDPSQWFNMLEKRGKDARGAFRYLQAQPSVRSDRIGIIGWSQGGGVVLMLLNVNVARLPAEAPRPSFRAAVAFYPVLCSDKEQPSDWRSNVPLLLLQGWNDTWTRAPPCKSFVDGAVARGVKIEMQIYPGAYHAFDLSYEPLHVVKARSPEGTWPYVGGDPAARRDAFARVPAFLARYLLQ